MFTTRRGLLAPQNTFLENITRRCDGQYSSFLLANARILDYPIVFTSVGFTKLTGFNRVEVLQQPCLFPFLRGPQTQKSAISTLENGILNNVSEQAEIIIYKKNLTPCWVLVRVTPVRNEKDCVILILVTFKDLSPIKQPLADEIVPGSGFAAIAQGDGNHGWDKLARLVAALMRQKSSQIAAENGEGHNTSDREEEPSADGKVAKKGCSASHENIQTSSPDKIPLHKVSSAKESFQNCESVNSENLKDAVNNIETGFSDYSLKKGKSKRSSQSKIKAWLSNQRSLFFYGSTLNEKSGIFGTGNLHGDFDDHLNQHNQSPLTVPRYRPEPPRPPKHVLLHYSIFRIIWDWIILLLTGYTIIVVPVRILILPKPAWIRIAEKENGLTNVSNSLNLHSYLEITDAIIDTTFIVDIILNFHTSFVGPGGEVIADSSVIKMNYLRGWFIFDLMSCVPYEKIKFFYLSVVEGINNGLDYLRLIRLLRLVRAARRIDQYMEHVSALLILMIVCFFILAHWFACCWYTIGVNDVEKNVRFGWIPRIFNDSLMPYDWSSLNMTLMRTNSQKTAVGAFIEKQRLPLIDLNQKWTTYLTALYFSLSLLTTIGFGNVAAFTEVEKAVSICFMLIGALVYATIFGNITTIVQQMYSTRTRYNEMMKGVRDFLKIHDVPGDLSERVIDYVTSSWAITKGIDTAKVLNYCPKDMQADLSVHLNRCVFNIYPAFRLASDGCLRSLAVNFQTLHTAPGDLVIHQGESVDQLSFIVSGSLEVIQDDEVIALLGKGDVFGSPNWKNENQAPSAVSVRALTYCNLHTIRLDRLKSVLSFYHAFANSFTRNLDITYNLCNRFIFRKLLDVKHELELAEKRRKEPPVSGLPVDHPVRKMISKLRRSSISTQDSNMNWNSQYTSEKHSLTSSICEDNIVLDDRQNHARKISTNLLEDSFGEAQSKVIYHSSSSDMPKDSIMTSDGKPKQTKYKQMSPWVYRAMNSRGPAHKWARLLAKAQQNSLQNLKEEMEEDKNSVDTFPRRGSKGSLVANDRMLKRVNSLRDKKHENASSPQRSFDRNNENLNDFEVLTNKRFERLEAHLTREFDQINIKFDHINENMKVMLEFLKRNQDFYFKGTQQKSLVSDMDNSYDITSSQSTIFSPEFSSIDSIKPNKKMTPKYLQPPELAYQSSLDSSLNRSPSQESRPYFASQPQTSRNPITLCPPSLKNPKVFKRG